MSLSCIPDLTMQTLLLLHILLLLSLMPFCWGGFDDGEDLTEFDDNDFTEFEEMDDDAGAEAEPVPRVKLDISPPSSGGDNDAVDDEATVELEGEQEGFEDSDTPVRIVNG